MDNDKNLKDGAASDFQFVTITKPGHGWKDKNEHIVRSHVMRLVRQKQREKRSPKPRGSQGRHVNGLGESSDRPAVDHAGQAREVDAEGAEAPENPMRALKSTRHSAFNAYVPPLRLPPSAKQLTIRDQRLLEHISNFYSPLISNISPKFTLWSRGMQNLVTIATSFDFLMHAVLGWSATHLAQITGDSKIQQDAYSHRALALNGLQIAIKSFSNDNADAVLCASIVMAWQSSDAKVWASMMRGCKTVKAKMLTTKIRSEFCNHGQQWSVGLDPDNLFNREIMTRALAIPSHAIDNTQPLFHEGLESLQALREYIWGPQNLLKAIDELIAYVEYVLEVESSEALTTRAELLAPLRSMLFWLPSKFIPILHSGPHVMLMMANMHALALLVNPVQDNESAFFRRLNVAPIQAFHEEFTMRAALESGPGERSGVYGRALGMMNFPLNGVAAFERRLLKFGCSGEDGRGAGELKTGIGWVNYAGCLTTFKILENFPVGLWHNSVS